MDSRNPEKWVEIEDPDSRVRIRLNSSSVSESEAMLLADELEHPLPPLPPIAVFTAVKSSAVYAT